MTVIEASASCIQCSTNQTGAQAIRRRRNCRSICERWAMKLPVCELRPDFLILARYLEGLVPVPFAGLGAAPEFESRVYGVGLKNRG
jgi:hypothetical protein